MMPAPLSNDMRIRIIKARERGDTIAQIAREKEVNQSTIVRLLRLYRETGSHEARPLNNGRKPRLSPETLEIIRERIKRQPDVTLRELIEEYSLPLSEAALCKIIKYKLGFVRKKTGYAAEQDREDIRLQRKQWKDHQATLDPHRLVFLDESGINTGMTRIYGRSSSHQRVREAMPDTRFERTSILSSVRMDGTMVPLVFEGALNGDLFKAYVEHMLAPSLKPGDIVIMDNLSSHKVKGIAGAIEAVGASVMYLPPYSPDLNPIELLWSKVKAILRKLKIRTKDLMDHAILQALDAISLDDIAAWFRHDGYALC